MLALRLFRELDEQSGRLERAGLPADYRTAGTKPDANIDRAIAAGVRFGDERKAQGSFCCSPRAACRSTSAADQSQGSATFARGTGLADRRTQNIGREEIVS